MYITPPASFTHFHQDGHGTVDSGHLCIKGYNEVVMLRRLTERHKKHALWILTGDRENVATSDPKYFDGLYSEPHGDGLVSLLLLSTGWNYRSANRIIYLSVDFSNREKNQSGPSMI
jgi:hypothetical protein